MLHIDLKELVLSHGGFRYAVFAIDEHSRYVFVDFIKLKSEVSDSVKRIVAAFNATVGVPVDESGRALPRPRVRAVHSDREGKLMSQHFLDFRAEASLHHTTSPPHDHDLNPIAERVIGLVSETACAVRSASGAPAGYWPWIISYVVDWHNSTVGSAGSSTADAAISPCQRFTLRPPRVMDLATFGCRAVVLKPPTHQHKPSLSSRGWVGTFLGRSRYSKGSYDVLVGRSVVTSSSVVVDEEYLPWSPGGKDHHPLTAVAHAPPQPQRDPLGAERAAGRQLKFLDLFSGSYSRTDGLAAALRADGWRSIDMVDNDGEIGGGWRHDLLNDATYAELLSKARSGEYDSMHIGFPCSTGAVSRLFDAPSSAGLDRGPPMVRSAEHPDGLPEGMLDPKYIKELRTSNQLLERVVDLAIAARLSSARTRITFEQPADRSAKGSVAYAADLAHHGSILATRAIRERLVPLLGMKSCTFAYCRLGSPLQKYTTILYTPELGPVLDALNEPSYQCNHERGTHAARVRGREADGSFSSKRSAAYPIQVCQFLSRAHTFGHTGDYKVPSVASVVAPGATRTIVERGIDHSAPPHATEAPTVLANPGSPAGGAASAGGVASADAAAAGRVPPSAVLAPASPAASPPPRSSPVSFPSYDLASPPSRGPLETSLPDDVRISAREGPDLFERRLAGATSVNPSNRERPATRSAPAPLPSVAEEPSSDPNSSLRTPGGTDSSYAPFDAEPPPTHAAEIMEDAVRASVLEAASDGHSTVYHELVPMTPWASCSRAPRANAAVPVLVALSASDELTPNRLAALHRALRADSPGAPASHGEAVKAGEVWIRAEEKELNNHAVNGSWTVDDHLPERRPCRTAPAQAHLGVQAQA